MSGDEVPVGKAAGSAGVGSKATGRQLDIPRVIFAAPKSGGGKTTVVCGMLAALSRQGMDPVGFKCGPDYIDPMFHRIVLGIPSFNLDLFFSSEQNAIALMERGSRGHGIAVLEGVMGYYDGMGPDDTKASAYHLSRTTQTPVILVVDANGAALSIAATCRGFLEMRPDSNIRGVILNRVNDAMAKMLAPAIERECGVPLLGCLPNDPAYSLESRHLGLVSASEVEGVCEKMQLIADALEANVDMGAVLKIAREAPAIACPEMQLGAAVDELVGAGHASAGSTVTGAKIGSPESGAAAASGIAAAGGIAATDMKRPTIAVASDHAFCFYYAENLRMLEDLGARIEEFSPIEDNTLPEGTCGIYIGGGYPELHAVELQANVEMRRAIREACEMGMPVFAECGGFMYLQQRMFDLDGNPFDMVGFLDGESRYTGKLTRFGYVDLECLEDTCFCDAGACMPAHEFHYYDSSCNGSSFIARKPSGKRSWECFAHRGNVLAGFPHLYFPECGGFAEKFVNAAVEYGEERVLHAQIPLEEEHSSRMKARPDEGHASHVQALPEEER